MLSFAVLLVASFYLPWWSHDIKWPLVTAVLFLGLFAWEICVATPLRKVQHAENELDAAKQQLAALESTVATRAPKLTAEILSLWWSKASHDRSTLFVQVQIVNGGSSQTIVRGYEMSAMLSDGKEVIGHNEHLSDGVRLKNAYDQTVQPFPRLYESTVNPIQEGGQAGGWMLFVFDAAFERLHQRETTLVFRFADAKGTSYSTTASATGAGGQGEAKYYPGAGNQPLKS